MCGSHGKCFSTNQQTQSEYNTSSAFSRMPTTMQVEVVNALQTLEIPLKEAEQSINIRRIKESYLRLAQKYHPDSTFDAADEENYDH